MTGVDPVPQTTGVEHLDIIDVLKSLMIEHALPLWSGEGWDSARKAAKSR